MPDFFLDLNDSEIDRMYPGKEAPFATKPTADGKVANIFLSIKERLNEKIVSETQAMYEFTLTGPEAGQWFIDLKTDQKGSCGQGKAPSAPDAAFNMDSDHFFEMFSGNLKPATAFMTGKLKISGNLQTAMKLEKLMKSLKAKL